MAALSAFIENPRDLGYILTRALNVTRRFIKLGLHRSDVADEYAAILIPTQQTERKRADGMVLRFDR
jgi:hypothetical protein